jgi:hypothetical protein
MKPPTEVEKTEKAALLQTYYKTVTTWGVAKQKWRLFCQFLGVAAHVVANKIANLFKALWSGLKTLGRKLCCCCTVKPNSKASLVQQMTTRTPLRAFNPAVC